MRISDWSSDVCSSDLLPPNRFRRKVRTAPPTPRTSVPAQARLDRLHVVVREAEMVADLVDQDVAHDMLQILAGVAPIVEDRPAVEIDHVEVDHRSEERRVGKECVSKCRSRWSPYHYKNTPQTTTENTESYTKTATTKRT